MGSSKQVQQKGMLFGIAGKLRRAWDTAGPGAGGRGSAAPAKAPGAMPKSATGARPGEAPLVDDPAKIRRRF